VPLDTEASGLMVLTQDGRVWRRLTEDGDEIEQEFVVEVSGDIAPDGLRKLNHGLHYGGRALAPCKVSWQNEVRLRFAIKGRKAAAGLVQPGTRWPDDPSGVRLLERHFHRLVPLMPLDTDASGLMVLTQDGRVRRQLTEDRDEIEQEFVVEVSGQIAPYGLFKLSHGLQYRGRPLRPCKVSWQNEIRLRFALKGVQEGQLRDMCSQVGLDVVAIRRIRIGKVPLAKMPVGAWRYLPAGERF